MADKQRRVAKPAKLTRQDRASGYERIPGDSARRYRKVGGRKVISRRQYEALRTREGIPRAAAPSQLTREATTRYWHFVRAWRDTQMPDATRRQVSQDADFKRELEAFRTSKDNSPNGPRARFLVKLGWRDETNRYQVGQTPKRYKGRRAA